MKKTKYLFTALWLIAATLITNAQDAEMHLRDFSPSYTIAYFSVYGKCGRCTLRILKAVDRQGVKSAFWDQDSQMLAVQYAAKAVRLAQIHAWIAGAGHDTEKVKAKAEAYNALPACCRYRTISNIQTSIKQKT